MFRAETGGQLREQIRHGKVILDPTFRREGEEGKPASTARIRKNMDVDETVQGKGLELTIRVTAYDTGMIQFDGVPITEGPPYNMGHGWLGAAEQAILTLNEFWRQWEKRQNAAV